MSALNDNVMIVTGASEGIGRAVCKAAGKRGAKVVLAARNAERLQSLQQEIESAGGKALAVPTDVTKEDACKALIERTVAEWGTIDTLINNAGSTMWTRFDEVTDLSVFENLMQLNYMSGVYTTSYALPHLKKSRGRIVGISSGLGLMGAETHTGYCATKHALFGFYDALRIELRETGVSVTVIAPDLVVSEIRKRAASADGTPLGKSPIDESKMLTAEQAAEIIVNAVEARSRVAFTSPRSRFIPLMKVIAPGVLDRLGASLFAHDEH